MEYSSFHPFLDLFHPPLPQLNWIQYLIPSCNIPATTPSWITSPSSPSPSSASLSLAVSDHCRGCSATRWILQHHGFLPITAGLLLLMGLICTSCDCTTQHHESYPSLSFNELVSFSWLGFCAQVQLSCASWFPCAVVQEVEICKCCVASIGLSY